MRILALDVGGRRIGLAVSDDGERLASGRGWIERHGGQGDLDAVLAATRRESAGLVVVGLPLALDGSDSPGTGRVRRFAESLARSGLEVRLWDERLTTAQALRAGGSRRKGELDERAAVLILQSFLDARRGDSHGASP
jgi:putative Holliday junction resolvase